jgi:hypothetical protein
MRKLARVANVVVNVGKSCKKYSLNERDLPDDLRTILGFTSEVRASYSSVVLGLTNEQRAGWSRTCTEEVREGKRRQRIPFA